MEKSYKVSQITETKGTASTVDDALSLTSTNPVQNKIITAELNKKLETVPEEYITETELNQKKYLTAADIVDKADKSTTLYGYGIENAYTKDQVNELISSVYKYKGSVLTFDNLPTSGNKVGDVWNVTDTDKNYAWDGTKWDDLGGLSGVDLSDYYTQTQVDNKLLLKADISDMNAKLANKANITDLDAKQDKLTAGKGIKITDNVISAEGGDQPVASGEAINYQPSMPELTSELYDKKQFIYTDDDQNMSYLTKNIPLIPDIKDPVEIKNFYNSVDYQTKQHQTCYYKNNIYYFHTVDTSPSAPIKKLNINTLTLEDVANTEKISLNISSVARYKNYAYIFCAYGYAYNHPEVAKLNLDTDTFEPCSWRIPSKSPDEKNDLFEIETLIYKDNIAYLKFSGWSTNYLKFNMIDGTSEWTKTIPETNHPEQWNDYRFLNIDDSHIYFTTGDSYYAYRYNYIDNHYEPWSPETSGKVKSILFVNDVCYVFTKSNIKNNIDIWDIQNNIINKEFQSFRLFIQSPDFEWLNDGTNWMSYYFDHGKFMTILGGRSDLLNNSFPLYQEFEWPTNIKQVKIAKNKINSFKQNEHNTEPWDGDLNNFLGNIHQIDNDNVFTNDNGKIQIYNSSNPGIQFINKLNTDNLYLGYNKNWENTPEKLSYIETKFNCDTSSSITKLNQEYGLTYQKPKFYKFYNGLSYFEDDVEYNRKDEFIFVTHSYDEFAPVGVEIFPGSIFKFRKPNNKVVHPEFSESIIVFNIPFSTYGINVPRSTDNSFCIIGGIFKDKTYSDQILSISLNDSRAETSEVCKLPFKLIVHYAFHDEVNHKVYIIKWTGDSSVSDSDKDKIIVWDYELNACLLINKKIDYSPWVSSPNQKPSDYLWFTYENNILCFSHNSNYLYKYDINSNKFTKICDIYGTIPFSSRLHLDDDMETKIVVSDKDIFCLSDRDEAGTTRQDLIWIHDLYDQIKAYYSKNKIGNYGRLLNAQKLATFDKWYNIYLSDDYIYLYDYYNSSRGGNSNQGIYCGQIKTRKPICDVEINPHSENYGGKDLRTLEINNQNYSIPHIKYYETMPATSTLVKGDIVLVKWKPEE